MADVASSSATSTGTGIVFLRCMSVLMALGLASVFV
jgi:hypothetical protein